MILLIGIMGDSILAQDWVLLEAVLEHAVSEVAGAWLPAGFLGGSWGGMVLLKEFRNTIHARKMLPERPPEQPK